MKNLHPYRASVLYLALLGVLALTVSSGLTYLVYRYEPYILGFGWPHWTLFFVAVSFTMAFALTPTTFTALLGGYFLGWASLPPMVVAYLAAAYIGYRVAGRVVGDRLLNTLVSSPKARNAVENLRSGQTKVIILARLSPVLPFAVMNVVLAMLKVDLRKYLGASLVGMLPRTALTVFAGTQARNIRQLLENPDENSFIRTGLILLTVASVGGLVYVFTRIFTRTAAGSPGR